MNDFEKRLSDISHKITEKTALPDAEQLLDTAKKESATKGKKIERRNAFCRNFVPALAMVILSVVFISGVYYYITHGSLRNPGSTEPSTQSSTESTTLSIDPTPLSYAETEQDGLVLSVSLDKTDYLIGEPIDITFALENNSGKTIYQKNSQLSEDDKFCVIASICDIDGNPLYQYNSSNGIDDTVIYELKDGERVERNFKYTPSDFSDAENQIINPGIYSVKASAQYTFTDLNGDDFETIIETDCNFFVDDYTDLHLKDQSIFRPMGFEYMQSETLFNCGLAPVCENDLWGYINKKGEMVIPAKFGYATPFNPDFEYAVVMSEPEKNGVINNKGQYIIPPKYDSITEIIDYSNPGIPSGFFKLETITDSNTLYGLADINGVIVEPQYDYIDHMFSDGLVIFQENDKVGYLNKKGDVVIEATFAEAELFCNGLAPVVFDKYGKWGYINEKGETEINPQFDFAEPFAFSKEVTPVRINEKWGLINDKGEYVAEPQFDSVLALSDSFLSVYKDDKEGLIDTKGNLVLEPKYDYISEHYYTDSYTPQYLMASLYDVVEKVQIFNLKGKMLTEITASDISFVTDEIFIFTKDGKSGLANINGEIIVKAKYDELLSAEKNNDKLIALTSSNYFVIDLKGNVLKSIDCDYIDYFSNNNITPFNKDHKYGIINSDGEILLDAKFLLLESLFYNDTPLFVAQKGFKEYGIVDSKGNYLLEAKYDDIYGFNDNYIVAGKDELYGIFYYDGKNINKITDTKYRMISDLEIGDMFY